MNINHGRDGALKMMALAWQTDGLSGITTSPIGFPGDSICNGEDTGGINCEDCGNPNQSHVIVGYDVNSILMIIQS